MEPNETDLQIPPVSRPLPDALNSGSVTDESQRFVTEVTGRFGVMPNFFRSASAAAGLIEKLWAFAQAAYLDSPLPALFKERLFVYLSRFCPVRYCIVRHVGFLIGQGRPAGDRDATPETIEQVIALLKLPLPDAIALAAVLTRLEAHAQPVALPAPATLLEADLFAALALMFVEPRRSSRARAAVQHAFGAATFELLTAYLAFIRTAHYWTETHPELSYEPDMVAVMAQHGELAQLLLDPTEAEHVQAGEALRQAQADLQRMQGALAEQEARLETALAVGQMATWWWNPQTDQVSTSNTMAELFGLLPGEIFTTSTDRLRLVHPDDVAQQRALIETAVQTGTGWQSEFRIIRPRDGETAWLEERTTTVRDPESGQLWLDGLVWDITERKQAEERQAFLLRLNDALGPLADPIDIQTVVTQTAMQYFGVDRCCYCELEDGNAIIRRDAARDDLPSIVGVYPLSSFAILQAVVDAGRPFRVRNVHTTDMVDEELRQLCIQLQAISFIDVPIIKEGKPVGVLCLVQSVPRDWTEFEVELTVEIAERTWATVERARTEAALRVSEERHRTLFDAIDEGVCLFERLPLRPDGRRDYCYLAMNPAMQAMFGIPDLSGQSIRDHFPAEIEAWYDDYDRVLETGQPLRFERESVPQGLVLEMFVTRLEDGSGRRLLAVMQDVTVRKRAEERQAHLAAIVESSDDAVISKSLQGIILSWNKGAEKIFGYTAVETIGQPITMLIPPSRVDEEPHILESIRRGETIAHYETVRQHKDGTEIDISLTVSPIRDKTGTIIGASKIARDITERKKAEQRERTLLEQSYAATAKFEAVFNQSGIFAGVLDLEGHLQEVNQQALEVCGYSKQAVLAQPFWATPWWRQSEAVQSQLRTATEQAAAGAIFRAILPYWWADGTEHVVDFALHPIRNQAGRVMLLHPTGIDITVRQQAETEREYLLQNLAVERAHLHALTVTLEQQVQARTAELTQRLQELDQFTYITSHDLKAPLRAIDHLAHWISDDAADLLPPQSREHLVKLRGRITRMERLLNDLLAYSRAGRYPYNTEQVDVAQLVDNILRLVTPPQGFAVSYQTPLPVVRTQKVPLETVLRNLISNAIKHHDRSDGHIDVAVQDLGAWLAFSVRDDGPGIAPEFHERIFQVFQTLKPRDQVEGSGMGLAIVKKLVEGRGGTITVESRAGHGATFYFTWPKV